MNTYNNFPRYLAAKRSVDDRALNRPVWESLRRALPAGRQRVLEIGAGIGTMANRVWEWELLRQADYTAIDADPANVAAGAAWWSAVAGTRPGFSLHWETIDLFDFIAREQGRQTWDLLIAHAFMDLVNVPGTLPGLLALLRPGGLLYLSLNFDGATILEPAIDPPLDALVERLYHQTMDERVTAGRPAGDSHTGRHLYHHLRAAGAEVLDAGSSDWVALPRPGANGQMGYPADEAYFIHFIIHTISTALAGHPALDPARFAAWVAGRHAQVKRGELVYIAHQLDYLGRKPWP